jgi:paraquat-inducible protein B
VSAQNNDWKLGLFVSLSAAVIFVSVAVLGASGLDETYIYAETYFDESVQGLDVGSPVKFRGAPVGSVSDIGVAPDMQHVRVVFDLQATKLLELGFKPSDEEMRKNLTQGGRIPSQADRWPRDLRVQLVSAGITGLKFLQIDVFPDDPLPEFPFEVAGNYVPPAPSMMKSLEGSLMATIEKAPEIAEKLDGALDRLNQKLDELQVKDLSEGAETLINTTNEKLAELDTKKLNEEAIQAMEELTATLKDTRATLKRLNAEGGAVESLENVAKQLDEQTKDINLKGTIDDLRDAADAVSATSDAITGLVNRGQLEQALISVEQAAASVRNLADALERDSDMLLKGRAERD